MRKIKIISTIVLATILLATQIIAVGAAPANQDTPPITGTVESITLETDAETGTTTVVVTLTDELGGTQTVRLSLEDATALGLLIDDETINPDAVGNPTEIDPALVIPEAPEETEEEAQHPVGSALANFFSDLLGVDYETVMDYHADGVGFGVIAQALWMTNALEGDSGTFAAILEAKQNNDFGEITLPDGSTPQNWGQFRKAVMHDREKSKENLGAIMSGRADDGQDEETPGDGNSNGNSNGNGNGSDNASDKGNNANNNGNGPDKNKDKGNNGKNNDNGNNKNKDKGKGNND
jgi:hypothetical protein